MLVLNKFKRFKWDKVNQLYKATEKKFEQKRKNLLRLGVDQEHAHALKGRASRKLSQRTFLAEEPNLRGGRRGDWSAEADQSPILITTITLSRLRGKRYESMLSYYIKSRPTGPSGRAQPTIQ